MATFPKDKLYLLESFCDDFDYDLRTNYSGRIMNGKTCIGFIADDVFSLGKSMALYLIDYPDLLGLFDYCKEDSLGRHNIIYFPEVQLED